MRYIWDTRATTYHSWIAELEDSPDTQGAIDQAHEARHNGRDQKGVVFDAAVAEGAWEACVFEKRIHCWMGIASNGGFTMKK